MMLKGSIRDSEYTKTIYLMVKYKSKLSKI